MSLIAIPPAPAAETAIDCGPFLPAITPTQARAAMRLDGTVTPDRLRTALVTAALAVAGELRGWIEQQQAAGHATLADVPAPRIDGQSAHVFRWQHAVRCLAAAELLERHRNYDSTNEGDREADRLAPQIDDLRRDARWAINDLRGIPRSTIELI